MKWIKSMVTESSNGNLVTSTLEIIIMMIDKVMELCNGLMVADTLVTGNKASKKVSVS